MSSSEFNTTRWSVVRNAGATEEDVRREALRDLCEAYWYPLYAYLRRIGKDADRAGDLVQGLFAKLIENDGLAQVEKAGGSFRSWLITCLRNHERDVLDHEGALRRGGGVQVLSIDIRDGEHRYGAEPAGGVDPDAAFERAWAQQVLDNAFTALEEEYRTSGRTDVFDRLAEGLKSGQEAVDQERVARELGLSSVALRVALHRLRGRYRLAVLGEVRATLGDGMDPGEELQSLLRALEGGA
jgi:RNA polymerase sigma-70 factor (ECF subfamily)